MASANWEKCKNDKVKHIIRHCSTDKRLEDEHGNRNINKSLTMNNISFYGSKTYDELCADYDARVNELDATTNTNKRKDRVTAMCIDIPVPESFVDAQGNVDPRCVDWLRRADEIVSEHLTGNGVSPKSHIYSIAHMDEIHRYYDPDEKRYRWSLPHLHRMDVAEINGGLNAKALETKKAMRELNDAIEEMSQNEFGLQWQTGTKRKSRSAVDELKNKSLKSENRMLKQKNRQLQQEIATRQMTLNNIQQREIDVERRENAVDERERRVNDIILSETETQMRAFSDAVNSDIVSALKTLPKTPYSIKAEQIATQSPAEARKQAIATTQQNIRYLQAKHMKGAANGDDMEKDDQTLTKK